MKQILLLLLLALTMASCHEKEIAALSITASGEGVSNNEVNMRSGNTLQLVIGYMPNTTTKRDVLYSSDNEAVATVSADGVVTAYDNGEATITVKSAEWPYATTQVKIYVTGATLDVSTDEVPQNQAEAREVGSEGCD
jgi:uncharacterized protein YjdB